jgi:hypothetical protein
MTVPTPDQNRNPRPALAGPPTVHQLALMIWVAVFPTLTVVNLALGDWLGTLTPVVRTFVLATIGRADRHLRAHAPAAQVPRSAPGLEREPLNGGRTDRDEPRGSRARLAR